MKSTHEQDYGEELFNVLANFLNRPSNRAFLDSIRGEYGVLWALSTATGTLTAGDLKDRLHVVPGRMTDILTSLENKGMIVRSREELDRRIVNVSITQKGRDEARKRRLQIHEKYHGLFEKIGHEDAKELVRLLSIMLTFSEE